MQMQRVASAGPAIRLDFDPGQLLLDPDQVLDDNGNFEKWCAAPRCPRACLACTVV